MKALLLTLGHNSSAIMVQNKQLLWGYETERVSGTKSDSRFPAQVFEMMSRKSCQNVDMVYVSHWSPDGQLSSMSGKHWDPTFFDGKPIRTLSADRSHHDAHIYGAMCYAGKRFPYEKGTYGVVVDGFGIFGEHLSVYDMSERTPKLVKRIHGYQTSMGLWYQYATAFMGMKMHEDEYKILGYEAHIMDDAGVNVEELDKAILQRTSQVLEDMQMSVYGSKFDPVYKLEALANVKAYIFDHLTDICRQFGVTDPADQRGRIVLGYYVQGVLENVVLNIVRSFNPRNLLLSGGCFYNVKLNKRLIDEVEGKICTYPLAGDQGNAIGLYYMDHPDFEFPDDLNWGKRVLHDVGAVQGLVVVKDEFQAHDIIARELSTTGFVNLVRGNMEFGPRAMCNTSTLALPTVDNVRKINDANNRNSFMPMAPVMTRGQYQSMFEKTERVWKSESHMIMGMEYKEYPLEQHLGIAHEYQRPHHHHTGRPQVIKPNDVLMERLLGTFGPLINTSFNFHGMPIALGMSSVVQNHMMQYQRNNQFKTVVVSNERQ